MVDRGWVRIAVSSFAMTCAVSCAKNPAKTPASAPNRWLAQPMPAFHRKSVTGEDVDSEAGRDRPLVVKFFAKYCVPCQKTLPELEAIHREKGDDVVVVGISEDELPGTTIQQMKTYGLSFPVVHDAGNVLAGRFRVDQMPITFVRDKNGRVAWVSGPGQDESELRQALDALPK
ncbi:MAG TPA: TlpA disulfide reductase family protein [Polyangiaceae bacterium]|nr:TlpA disulfide reductase family protein [Polyangiaceae bacterium]